MNRRELLEQGVLAGAVASNGGKLSVEVNG
jgi:hypothetical protein